jgi:hypothetical protein
VPVFFAFRDLDAYEQWVIGVAGPFAMVPASPFAQSRAEGTHSSDAP